MKIAVLVAVLFVSSCGQRTAIPRFQVADFTGEWVVKDYIEEVRRTREPHQAWSPELWALSFSVVKAGPQAKYDFNATTLNEGGLSGTISRLEPAERSDVLRLVIAGQEDYLLLRIESGDKHPVETVRVEDSRGSSALFVRLPTTLEQYVNRLVIAGRYRDVSGEEYSFDEAGEARWPGKTFHYEVSLNPIEAGCEYIEHDDPNGVGGRKRYGYRWNEEELDLFDINYVGTKRCNICCDAKPFAALRRHN